MNRPKVVTVDSASLDGRLTISRETLLFPVVDPRWESITPPADLDVGRWLKAYHHPEATLEGSGSFARDDEEPAPLPTYEGDPALLRQDYLPEHIIHRPGHRGWFTAVDSRGRIRWVYKEFPDEEWKGWYPCVFVSESTPLEYLAYLQREEIPYLIAGREKVDLCRVLEKFKELLGVTCVLSTAGGRLNGALLRAGVVDEVNVEVLPGVIGGFDTPSLFDSPDLKAGENPVHLELISVHTEAGGKVWLRYEVIH